MASDRGQPLLFIVATVLVAICLGAAVRVVSADGAHQTPEPAVTGDDLLLDFTGRAVSAAVPWHVAGSTDSVRHTARGLLVVSSTADDPPRLVLELGAPKESFSTLEVTMALNKGASGSVWGSRYAGERPPADQHWSFPLEPGQGVRTYRVNLEAGQLRGAPLHSLNIQLTDAPVRAVVRQVRLLRTAGWRSYIRCRSGLESTVVLGGIGVSAVVAPESGGLTLDVDLPAHRPLLQLATAIHPMQKMLGRPGTGFRARLVPLDGPDAGEEHAEVVFQRQVDPTDPDQRRWFFDQADLSAWAGRRVRLVLDALTWRREGEGPERLLPGRPQWAMPLWGPVMISGGAADGAPPSTGMVLVLLDGVGQSELGCYGDPGGFPAVSRYLGGAANLRSAYLVEYGRHRFFQTLFGADYFTPGQSLVTQLRGRGVRTAAFYSGGTAEQLLRDERLQAGFQLIGRSEFELGLPPAAGDEWSASNPLFALPGPLSWLRQLGREPFFLVVHLGAGGSKVSARADRLAAIDGAIGRLAALLDAQGRLHDTVICLAGLRGPVREARVDRGCRLWDESALIPLLVSAPGGLPGAPGRDRIFRSIDILPTLCGLAGLEMDTGNGAGLSLAPWLRGEEAGAWPVDEVYISQRREGRRYLGLRRGPIKLIWRVEPLAQAACYDLDADPGERVDISPSGLFNQPLFSADPLGPQLYTQMVRRLEAHFGPRP